MSAVETIAAVSTPEALFELLDSEVMWYSADVDSNLTCNDREDAIACIKRNLEWETMTGRFHVVGSRDDFVVVQAVLDNGPQFQGALLLRFRDGLILEMRDFDSADAACRYAGIQAVTA
jgi:hypothetical protein